MQKCVRCVTSDCALVQETEPASPRSRCGLGQTVCENTMHDDGCCDTELRHKERLPVSLLGVMMSR